MTTGKPCRAGWGGLVLIENDRECKEQRAKGLRLGRVGTLCSRDEADRVEARCQRLVV